MINRIIRIALLTVLALTMFASCENPMVRQILPYTVDFDSNDGEPAPGSQRMMRHETASQPRIIMHKEGYNREKYGFGGWFTDNDIFLKEWDFKKGITEDMTLYAKWDLNYYDVIFLSRDGDTIYNEEIAHGAKAVEPLDPEWDGHIFRGWYEDEGCTIQWNFNKTITKHTFIHARWDAIRFTVAFDAVGGEPEPAQRELFWGSKVPRPVPEPAKDGFTFGGWFSDRDEYDHPWHFDDGFLYADLILYAYWIPEDAEYTVVFNLGGASGLPPASQTATGVNNFKIPKPVTDPAREGYNFIGWFDDAAVPPQEWNFFEDKVHKDMALTAHWAIKTFTVTFDANSGKFGDESAIKYVAVDWNAAVAELEVAREGHDFVHWFRNIEPYNEYNFGNPVTESFILYARWDIKSYTVKFEADGGEPAPIPQDVVYSGFADEPVKMAKDGYTFGGWYSDEVHHWHFDDNTVTGDLTLYARWIEKTAVYIVNFDLDGGEGETPETQEAVFENDYQITEPITAPVKEGHSFTGWYEKGVDPPHEWNFENGIVSRSMTLIAGWDINTFTVTFFANSGEFDNGAALMIETVDWKTKVASPGDPSRARYTFGNWYTQETGGIPFNFSSEIVGNIALYARWIPIQATSATLNLTRLGMVVESLPGEKSEGDSEILSLTIIPSDTYYETITWTSSSEDIATVTPAAENSLQAVVENESGEVGITTISVAIDGVIWAECIVRVLDVSVEEISAGTFTMGSPAGESGRISSREAQQSITLSAGFNMGKYMVTQRQYQKVMGTNPSSFPANTSGDVERAEFPGHLPVERVSWYDALVFCNKLSILHGFEPVYQINGVKDTDTWGAVPTSNDADWDSVMPDAGADGYRMPTSAEWEYACRAGTLGAFNWGTNLVHTNMANYQATHANSAGLADTAGPQIDRRKTTEVWTFSEHDNIWGLCDMHGNVFEWCHDWVTHSLLGTVHNDVVSSNGDALNGPIMSNPPTGAANFARIRRGGAFGHGAHEMRSAYWYYSTPHTRDARIGVRLVRAL